MQCDQKERTGQSTAVAVAGGHSIGKKGVHSVYKNFCFNSRGIAKFWLRWQLSVAYSRHAHAFAGAQICHSLHFFGPDILLLGF